MRKQTTRPVDLAALALVALAAPAAALLLPDGSALRVALGLVFLLIAPGYALVAALFPERAREYDVRKGEDGEETETVREGLEPLERAGLSLGLSIAVVPLLGLLLNATPWGIRLVPILIAVAAFTLVASAVALVRRDRLAPAERPVFAIAVDVAAWREMRPIDRALTVILALSVVAAAGALAYVLATPRPAERFTEFYILGPSGKAEGYPTTMAPGGTAPLTVGVVNHEGEATSYERSLVWIQGELTGDGENRTFAARAERPAITSSLTLQDEETREENLTITAPEPAGTWKLELRLHKAGSPDVYRRLHLYVDVR